MILRFIREIARQALLLVLIVVLYIYMMILVVFWLGPAYTITGKDKSNAKMIKWFTKALNFLGYDEKAFRG